MCRLSGFPFCTRRFSLDHLPELHPLPNGLLVPERRRLVPFGPAQRLRQVLLRHVRVLGVERVLVARTISQLLHEWRGRVTDVQRYRLGGGGPRRGPPLFPNPRPPGWFWGRRGRKRRLCGGPPLLPAAAGEERGFCAPRAP